ncbi:MAG: hypothetical protein ACOYEO_02535 [bacterium]|jgi:hypothetical protein
MDGRKKCTKLARLVLLMVLVLCLPAKGKHLMIPGNEVIGAGFDRGVRAADDMVGSIHLAEPGVVVAVITMPRLSDDLVSVSDVVQALSGTITWQDADKLVAKLPQGDLLTISAQSTLVQWGQQKIMLEKKPKIKADRLHLCLSDVKRLWSYRALVEEQEIVFLPGDSSKQDFIWEEVRTFCSGPAWYVVGRITNKATYASELTKVSWDVGNDQGQVLASSDGYVQFLNPGESKPFKLMLPFIAEASWYRLKLTPGFAAKPRPLDLTSCAKPYADRGVAYISLLGQLTNEGPEGQDFIKVMVEFLDDKGRLVDVDWAFINYLGPKESQNFTVYTSRLEAKQWRICFD